MRALGACILFLLAIQYRVWVERSLPWRVRAIEAAMILGACLLLTGGR